MGNRTVVSVGCQIPGGLGEFIDFQSKASLLDWDIILFDPDIGDFAHEYDTYQGKPCLSDNRSFQLKEAIDHWKRELSEAFRAGKTIFVILSQFQGVFAATGKMEYSGTGRNHQTTRIVAPLKNYDALPIQMSVSVSAGKAMKLTPEGTLLADYWREFANYSAYEVLISGKIGIPMLVTIAGTKTVSALIQNRDTGGAIILLPNLDLNSEEFYEKEKQETENKQAEDDQDDDDDDDDVDEDDIDDEGDLVWTKAGSVFGHKFLGCLVAIDAALKQASATTPAPQWTSDAAYVLPKEGKFREQLLIVETSIEELSGKKQQLQVEITEESALRRLLYEKGPPLETAILLALKLLGFRAEHYRDSESEFDVIFDSAEGRLLSEAEGRDSSSINVDKLRQLEMNIHEDFERDGVTEMAKPVLFGNVFRLRPQNERGEYFTQKCITAAKRSKTALVRTPDLFTAAQYLSDTTDYEFAKKCREAIFMAEGAIVAFPEVPAASERMVVRDAVE